MDNYKFDKDRLYNFRSIIIQEVLELIYFDKPVLLFSLSQDDLTNLRHMFHDLHYVLADPNINPTHSENNNQLVAISKNHEKAREIIEAQADQNHKLIGKLLGYPECCIDRYENEYKHIKPAEAVSKISNGEKNSYLLNNLFNFSTRLKPYQIASLRAYYKQNSALFPNILYYQFISHIPCSYDCPASLKIGKNINSKMNIIYPEANRHISGVLASSMLFFDTFEWVIFDGVVNENELTYNSIKQPISLIDRKFLNKLLQGDKMIVKDNQIKIFKQGKLKHHHPRKNVYDGVLINFQ